jgi:putative spermidine/putrescine transport system ATP-binding protein
MARLSIDRICKRYGEVNAVSDVTLEVADGEFVVLLGPSGCGKTTTLRVIAGFAEPTSGSVRLGERDITRMPPWRRNAGLVFQSYALFPHLTVAENVAFGLQMRRTPADQAARRIGEMLRLVRLEHLAARLPRELSGGQQQRVALARALVFRPDVLLLDEPLSSLDAKLRQEVRVEIRELQRNIGLTTVMVTHDQEEALTMADRLVVMREGTVRQVGTQRDLYERPADAFVAGFVGRSSFIAGAIEAPGRFRSAGGLDILCVADNVGPATLALRPERIRLAAAPQADMDNDHPGVVEFLSYLGATIDVHVRISPQERLIVEVGSAAAPPYLRVGEKVRVAWPAASGMIFAD